MFDHPDAVTVHRLDLDTSGLMVLALSKSAVRNLNRQFRDRSIKKNYLADVWGKVDEDSGQVDLPISPDPFKRPNQLVDYESGKAALTLFEVLERGSLSTRLKLSPITGRTHQLRLHLASIGHPILGCDLYAHEEAFKVSDRLMLHADYMAFCHPGTGEPIEFRSSVSLDR